MADQTFAARLREHAATVRGFLDEQHEDEAAWAVPVTFMPFSPQEADALADALEAAERWDDHLPGCAMWRHEVEHLGQLLICSGRDTLVVDEDCTCGYDEFRAKVDHLDARVAVKSAEGQPGS